MKKAKIFTVLILIATIFLISDFSIFSFVIHSGSTAQAENIISGIPNASVAVGADGAVTFGGSHSNVTEIMISRTSDFAGISWQPFSAEKFKIIGETREALYIRFKSDRNVVSDTVVYTPVLNEGDIVKTSNNPDVYIVKYKNNKQYKRLILSPSVFNSYGHLKWENLKIATQEQLDAYNTSNLVQVSGDKSVYLLTPYGDEGEKVVLDTSKIYDADSVYEINTVDRDSYRSVTSSCSGSNTQSCAVVHGTGSQVRTCSSGTWSGWGSCVPVSCDKDYQIAGNACVSSLDTIKPVITAFSVPSTSSSFRVAISNFTATDNKGVTGYALTESSVIPVFSKFSSTKPSSYTFASSSTKTLYAWVRDAAGNVSLPFYDSVTVSAASGGSGGSSGGTGSSCSGSNTQSCNIANGIGFQSRTCASGIWSAWGNCTVVSCNSGYEISGNACVASADTVKPIITAFAIPATYSSLVVPVSSFNATDNVGVTGYLLTDTSSAPSSGATGWTASTPSSYTFNSEGTKTLYAWAKDAAGNVSLSLNDSVTITLPDTIAPVISSISSSVTSTGATITWTTNENATSVVDYGETASYGLTSSSASRVTSHSITLMGLAASTLYHYRISSVDASSNVAASTDYAFTTSAASGYITGPMSSSAKAIFLHHSTGGIVWDSGVANDISSYNNSHGTNYNVMDSLFPKESPYGWNNYPYDYWNIWVNHSGSSAYMEEPTLEMLTQTYDVIIWKHCFPGSNILADTGSPDISSSVKSLENYKLQYDALKQKMHQFPNKRFIVWTGAALVESATTPENAARAQEFANWVTTTWDEPGDNIFVWDFRQLETEGGLYLLPEHAASTSDSHPNSTFAAEVAPIFANRIIEVIKGRG